MSTLRLIFYRINTLLLDFNPLATKKLVLMTDIAFKEWTGVCEALGSGEQSVILRKGGIHEKSGGFQWSHDNFWLFPTLFHEENKFLKESKQNQNTDTTEPKFIPIQYLAKITHKQRIENIDTALSLDNFHIWKDDVIKDRFEWSEDKCLWLAIVRVFKTNLIKVPWKASYGGCRSWVSIDCLNAEHEFSSILADKQHQELSDDIIKKLN